MDLAWDDTARSRDESEEIESIETTEVEVVEIGEIERLLAAQEMICGGAMISRSNRCHNLGVSRNSHERSQRVCHTSRDGDMIYLDI
jgi:hypothetical protein